MQKNYFFALLFSLTFMISLQGFSQSIVNKAPIHQNIDGLSIYPNPVQSGKQYVYITSKNNLTKNIEIFNVLGKQIYSTQLTGKELNISTLNTGVYILKVTEKNVSESRKLVIM
jgi:hypothetical protein